MWLIFCLSTCKYSCDIYCSNSMIVCEVHDFLYFAVVSYRPILPIPVGIVPMALEQSYGGSRASEVAVEDLRSSTTNTDYNRSTYIKLLILPDLCFSDAFKLLTWVIFACIALTSWARWLSNHQPYVCLLNLLFRCRSKNNKSSPSLAFLRGFPSQRARNAEKLPFFMASSCGWHLISDMPYGLMITLAHQITKLEYFSYRLAVVYAQSNEARC